MAGPYDCIVSIGGQSFVDGLWRIMGPALEGLTNPLPIVLPGFSNAEIRIAQIIPLLPANGALNVLTTVTVTAEALLPVVNALNSLSVVPVAVELTPTAAVAVPALVKIAAFGPAPVTRFSLAFIAADVSVGTVNLDPNLNTTLLAELTNARARIVAQLGVTVPQPTIPAAVIDNLFTPPPGMQSLAELIGAAVDDALTRLVAETGRLVFPPAGLGSSCDAVMLPTEADAQLIANTTGSYVLQVGFKRPGTGDIQGFGPFFPNTTFDAEVLIGNNLVLELLCCLIERLPAFVLPVAAVTGTIDVDNQTHLRCCTFTDATAVFGPLALEGGVSVCIDAAVQGPLKEFSIVGLFTMDVPNFVPVISSAISKMATIRVKFILPVAFELDDTAALAGLRPTGTSERIDVTVSPSIALLAAIAALVAAIFVISGGLFSFLWAGAMFLACWALLVALGYVVSGAVEFLLKEAARTVLAGASLLRSPVAVPPGLFEAFGRFAPATMQVDALASLGVLHTPTSPWALLPRLALPGTRDPGKPPPRPKRPQRRAVATRPDRKSGTQSHKRASARKRS